MAANIVVMVLFAAVALWAFRRIVRHTSPVYRRDPEFELRTGICSECRGGCTALTVDDVEVSCPRCRGTGNAPVADRTG